ncbi:MAG: hypothetical protein VZR73_15995, partial [Acutalibacteraceae bacterium]|nr:hypothetical protein [Acutalibacteraceae bacterium]
MVLITDRHPASDVFPANLRKIQVVYEQKIHVLAGITSIYTGLQRLKVRNILYKERIFRSSIACKGTILRRCLSARQEEYQRKYDRQCCHTQTADPHGSFSSSSL